MSEISEQLTKAVNEMTSKLARTKAMVGRIDEINKSIRVCDEEIEDLKSIGLRQRSMTTDKVTISFSNVEHGLPCRYEIKTELPIFDIANTLSQLIEQSKAVLLDYRSKAEASAREICGE